MLIWTGSLRAETVGFDRDTIGAAPSGWLATKTGDGSPQWTVERDSTAPSPPAVLRQSGTAKYPVCLRLHSTLKDGHVEVKFKVIAGKEDQTGGLVWRARDAANQWHCLRVEFAANRFKVILNQKPLFEVQDDTFPEAGLVGVWTKADSVTLFDDFSFQAK
jgi:hypothetical protein